ncbi:MAG: hypothetical protein U0U09_01520 [Cyclobacteriaceae bacterium]
MKKIVLSVVLFCSAIAAYSQLYVRLDVGYGLPINGDQIGTETNQKYDFNVGTYTGKTTGVYGSFGSGMSFHVAAGATINGVLGYDVELGYLLGKKYSVNSSSFDGTYTETNKAEMSSRSFQIAPALTFTAGTGNIHPYTRIGPVIGINKIRNEETQFDDYNSLKEVREYEYTGGISAGLKGVVGISFRAGEKINIFGEVSFVSMSYAPKERELTSYTINGDDALDSVPKADRKIEFKKEVKYSDNNSSVQQKYSMGSLGLQIGVKYMLK